MARLSDIPEPARTRWRDIDCPTFDTDSWVVGPPLSERRIAVISTAGLQRRGDRPFTFGAIDYRIVPAETPADDLVLCHVSPNFDRSAFQQDVNVIFPLDRLREFAAEGTIGSVANYHYTFMGASDPVLMKDAALDMVAPMKQDAVDTVLLVPV